MQMVDMDSQCIHTKHTTWQAWLVCFLASLFFFYEFIQGNMFASIANDIMRDFHIQALEMTYLSSIYYASNVIFLFIAGFLLDRFSAKKIILAAMLMCVLSTFVLADADSFYLALVCRFLTGIGSAFCFLGPVRIASRWFPPKRMAFVTGAVVTMAMTGGMLAQYPLTQLVMHVGWRCSLLIVGALGLVMWVLMLLGMKDQPYKTGAVRAPMSVLDSAKLAYLNLQTLAAAAYTSLMNMSVAVFGAVMGTLYLIQRLHVTPSDASMVNTMLFLGAIVGGPCMGLWSDKLSLRLLPMKAGAVASLLTVCGILYLPVSLQMMSVLFFLLGFFTASQVISYALVAESSLPWMTATAVSMVSILTQGGYIVYQNLFSWILLKQGQMHLIHGVPTYTLQAYHAAGVILPLGLLLALILSCCLKETYAKPLKS